MINLINSSFWSREPSGGALVGDRPRVIISSDIGGSDPDDYQSFIHLLLYSDLIDLEGLISSPPGKGRAQDFHKVIDLYEKDYVNLKTYSSLYPIPSDLRSIVKQGAIDPAPVSGYSSPTEGSEWLVQCAKKEDTRPLFVLVWGCITDVAQALHDSPEILPQLRVYFIAGWNRDQDPNAYYYIDKNFPNLYLIDSHTTFRGMYVGGDQSEDLGNATFVSNHVKDHGCMGNFFATLKTTSGNGAIKMGDTPSFLWLLRGPRDPLKDSWGGRYIRRPDRPNWFIDDPDPKWEEGKYPGAKTVNMWRVSYLRDWQMRMDRCQKPFSK